MQVDDKLKLSENIDILNYLVKAKLFNSPLMIREGDAPYIIKNVNLFTRDIALVPADQDASKIDLLEAAVLKIKNDRKNISFVSSIKKIHGGKLIIADIPKTIEIINERKSHRYVVDTNYREKVVIRNLENVSSKIIEVEIMDISETGVALRLPSTYNLKRRDIVQLTVGSEYQFLNGIKAEIVCLNNVFDNEGNRFVKMALSFKKQIPEERIRIAIPLL